jgi:hypothetical protein
LLILEKNFLPVKAPYILNAYKAETRMETARRMKKDDVPIEQIVKYTDLTPEEIERI